jgi:hypothetical protein
MGFDEWYQKEDTGKWTGDRIPDFDYDAVLGNTIAYICLEQITYGSQYGGTVWSINPSKPNDERERRIVKKFFKAIYDRNQNFIVTNSLFEGDPDPNRRKKCVLTYRMHPNWPLLRQTAYEHEGMNFFRHVQQIRYGDVIVTENPDVYERFNRALRNSLEIYQNGWANTLALRSYAPDAVEVTNANLGGDPKYGVRKVVKVVYEMTGEHMRYCYASEGERWPNLDKFKTSLGEDLIKTWEGRPGGLF